MSDKATTRRMREERIFFWLMGIRVGTLLGTTSHDVLALPAFIIICVGLGLNEWSGHKWSKRLNR